MHDPTTQGKDPFAWHDLTADQVRKTVFIRDQFRHLWMAICDVLPQSADKTLAWRRLREAKTLAVEAIVLQRSEGDPAQVVLNLNEKA